MQNLIKYCVQGLKTVKIKGKFQVCKKGMGRSNIVGTPLSILLSRKGFDATVTLVHSKTENLMHETSQADILIAAIGIPYFVKENMVKKGAVVIDVGINRVEAPETKSGLNVDPGG